MNRPRTYSIMIAICCLLTLPAAWADDASHRQEIEKLFRLTQMEQKVNESVDNLVEMQIRQSPELARHRDIVRKFFERQIGWSALHSDIANMYVKAFSEQELKQMNAFYITPIGQKVLTRVPELVQIRNQLAAQRLQSHIGELRQELEAASKKAP